MAGGGARFREGPDWDAVEGTGGAADGRFGGCVVVVIDRLIVGAEEHVGEYAVVAIPAYRIGFVGVNGYFVCEDVVLEPGVELISAAVNFFVASLAGKSPVSAF